MLGLMLGSFCRCLSIPCFVSRSWVVRKRGRRFVLFARFVKINPPYHASDASSLKPLLDRRMVHRFAKNVKENRCHPFQHIKC
ncbi:hypothetical protein BKA57DRAFT_462825 [Linnemannia elongata]|nr:hypothetical protein BKA57DRAFT_462824 [Linnemannia elongata]KAH7049015.1 hypothetical protein BKA57DRAFT_462825 [Linnemannia elongata]